VVVRRDVDGQLFFAPSSWRDAEDRPIEAPVPLARASARPGGPAGAGEVLMPEKEDKGAATDLDE
jgi:hypothetical protein